ncbi:hypothetical protein [Paenibacillus sp. YYML68]|uniref:hypothetical protein n=1 Tax=Paenibacillus sp. YYML68 TaxID=2909250 RepID=UPI00249395CC|nr:hypothetical protein [Paenibacillus sp. YYML68]
MMLGLVWIIGCYVAGMSIIHTLHWRWKRRGRSGLTHYVVRTRNNGQHVEWFLRSLHFFSSLKGKPITVTLADEGSTDDTLLIAERLRQEYQLTIHKDAEDTSLWLSEHEDEQIVLVQLNQQELLGTAYKLM